MVSNPLSGARYLVRGMKLISRPRIRRFVIVPLLINMVLFISIIAYGVNQFDALVAWIMPDIPEWLQWLAWLLWVIFVLGTLVVVFYTFTLIANLLSAPFNGLLAEAVERHLTGRPPDSGTSFSSLLKEMSASIVQELKKLAYMATRALPLLLLFVIPLVNVAAPLLWLIFGAWLLALEYADYPMGNHGIRFTGVRSRLAEKRGMSLGFGGATMIATMIPLVNFFVIPAAVAGATAMWVEEFADRDHQPNES